MSTDINARVTDDPIYEKGNPTNRTTPKDKATTCESPSNNPLGDIPEPEGAYTGKPTPRLQRSFKLLLLPATMVALIIALTGTGGASATESESGTSADEIIYVPRSNPLPGARKVVEPGVVEDGECLIQGHLEDDGGTPGAIVQQIVKVNLTTCQITLRRLAIPLENLHRYDTSTTSRDAAQESLRVTAEKANSSESEARTAVNHYFGSIKFNWEDPPQIDVTTTKSTVRWRQEQGSSCLSGANFEAHWGWASSTGWNRETASWQHDFDCGCASMNTYGTYHNSVFCPTGATDTDHYNTFFSGKPNGAWYVQWGASKSGGCTNLLSPEHIIVHP